ncbi:MAG: hypothetical protein HGA45_34605 [Chloroflexales bacterium]|nr:hypothetical protein [Chloroflexales bacterium]
MIEFLGGVLWGIGEALRLNPLIFEIVEGGPNAGWVILGVANAIVKALQLRGYRLGSGKPVTVLGFSGGAQIALGTAPFLKPMLKASSGR